MLKVQRLLTRCKIRNPKHSKMKKGKQPFFDISEVMIGTTCGSTQK